MADKQKKDNFFKRIASYLKATKSEAKKVTWPSKKQIINNTGIVIACIIVVGVFIAVLNFIFSSGFGLLSKDYSAVDPTDATEATETKEAEEFESESETGTFVIE